MIFISEHEEFNSNIASLLTSGLEKLFQNVKNEHISNEVLLKLLNCDKSGMQLLEQCALLIHVVDTMSVDLTVKGKLLKALEHENCTLNDLKEMFSQKEILVLELQSEVKRLQQVIHENKVGKCPC